MTKYVWILFILFLSSAMLSAVTLDFENGSAPGFAPSAGMSITNQFEQSHGMFFSANARNGRDLVLADVGGSRQGFGSAAGQDRLLSGEPDIGSFFLATEVKQFDFNITFSNPTDHFSGLVFDFESVSDPEVLTMEALNDEGDVVDTIVITHNVSGTGDGRATGFAFNRSQRDIVSIHLTGVRNDPNRGFGTGFDSLNTGTATAPLVPEANTFLLFLLAGGILATSTFWR